MNEVLLYHGSPFLGYSGLVARNHRRLWKLDNNVYVPQSLVTLLGLQITCEESALIKIPFPLGTSTWLNAMHTSDPSRFVDPESFLERFSLHLVGSRVVSALLPQLQIASKQRSFRSHYWCSKTQVNQLRLTLREGAEPIRIGEWDLFNGDLLESPSIGRHNMFCYDYVYLSSGKLSFHGCLPSIAFSHKYVSPYWLSTQLAEAANLTFTRSHRVANCDKALVNGDAVVELDTLKYLAEYRPIYLPHGRPLTNRFTAALAARKHNCSSPLWTPMCVPPPGKTFSGATVSFSSTDSNRLLRQLC